METGSHVREVEERGLRPLVEGNWHYSPAAQRFFVPRPPKLKFSTQMSSILSDGIQMKVINNECNPRTPFVRLGHVVASAGQRPARHVGNGPPAAPQKSLPRHTEDQGQGGGGGKSTSTTSAPIRTFNASRVPHLWPQFSFTKDVPAGIRARGNHLLHAGTPASAHSWTLSRITPKLVDPPVKYSRRWHPACFRWNEQMGKNYADMDDYVRRLDRDRVRLITKLKVRGSVLVRSFETGNVIPRIQTEYRPGRCETSFSEQNI